MLLKIPIEFKKQFTRKAHRALVGIAGFAVRSGEYYLRDVTPLEKWTNRLCPLVDGRLAEWFVGKKDVDYYIHIDLSITKDRAGFAIGHHEVDKYWIDLGFALDPVQFGEIDINELINLIITLKNNREFRIRLV
ncbi:MAG TPA: hypothetical protein ENH82_11305, partial [bacterium]|nr:hypothetical protein [bacterium]